MSVRLVLVLVLIVSAPAHAQMGLLGVQAVERTAAIGGGAVAAAPVPGTPDDPEELRLALLRTRDELRRARDRAKHLDESIPGYAPGGYWDRHYRKELARAEKSLPYAEAEVRRANGVLAKIRRGMNFDLVSMEITGHRDDWQAASRLRDAKKAVASARAQVEKHIPEGHASMTKSRAELAPQILELEARVQALEAKKAQLNARGIRVDWGDKLP